jgi:phosphoribosylaminoimidazolesuccinocarboxamide synthase
MAQESPLVIYEAPDGTIALDVRLEGESVWLTQAQMAELFQTDPSVIVKHISNIYRTGELDEEGTCAKNAHVQKEGNRLVTRNLRYYNLDVIISVGYRVNAKRGIAFRKWATKLLREYLLKGFVANQAYLVQHYEDLKTVVQLLERTRSACEKGRTEETEALFSLVVDYTYALDTLDRYDYQNLTVAETTNEERFKATYEEAMAAIALLKEKFGANRWFAHEKDDSFKSSLGQLYQTFDGIDLYPSVEEKAAILLYLVVKNHSFSDGNKRIAATLFLWFMEKNKILYAPDGRKRISDGTLVALTLLIAESRTEEKDVILKVVVNLINQRNM